MVNCNNTQLHLVAIFLVNLGLWVAPLEIREFDAKF